MKPRRIGCVILFLCPFFTCSILKSGFVQKLPTYFLPPACNESLFTQFIDNPLSELRVTYDLYRQKRVIAIDTSGKDVCTFTFWSYTSPDGKYVAFTISQSSPTYVQHLFIVDTHDQSYVHFTPENSEERIEDIAWSPDSQILATMSFSSFCCGPMTHTYVDLISPEESIRRADLGVNNIYRGQLEWDRDSSRVSYGHNVLWAWGIPGATVVGEPYWCHINRIDADWYCEEAVRDS